MKLLLKRTWHFLKDLSDEFTKDRVPTWAAAISFFAILSAFPLLLLIVAGMAQFLGSSEVALNKVMHLLRDASPSSTEMVRGILVGLMEVRGAIGLLGGITLLWVGSQIFLTLEGAVNIAWGTQKRPFWKSRLLAMGITLLLGALALSSISLTWLTATVRGIAIVPDVLKEWVQAGTGLALPMLLSFIMFTLIYKILPNTKVPWRIAALGAGFSAVAWELAKQGFGAYLTHLARYTSLYGSLAGVVILVIWVYYSAVIILLGAEIASLVQDQEAALARAPADPAPSTSQWPPAAR